MCTSASTARPLRQAYIDAGYCRNSVNDYVRRVRRMFRWAVVQELVPPAVFQALQAVEGLRAGESSARDIQPVPEAYINAVMPHVSLQVAAMIKLQLLCGCRPAEITMVRASDIDMTGKLWAYTPPHHKTKHFGKKRTIYFGPKSQEILRAFLKPDVNACLSTTELAIRLSVSQSTMMNKVEGRPRDAGAVSVSSRLDAAEHASAQPAGLARRGRGSRASGESGRRR